jgi:hypothetical protein
MSRLRPGEHSPCVADEPVDAEIPCFALAPVPDPHLLPAENLRALQETDPDCQHLLHHFGCTGSLDYDPSGSLGHVLPSGEFKVQLPRVLATSAPVTVYEEASYGPEDAPILKREEYRGSYQDNFTFLPPTPPELDVSAAVAEVLPQSLVVH